MTSKYGFSVVAPISVRRPDSTAGRSASCCALLKRWISSRKRIVRRPFGAQPLGRPREHGANVRDRCGDRRQLLERRPGRARDDAGERRLPAPGRPVEHGGADAVLGDRARERGARRRRPSPCPTKSSRRSGRRRAASGAISAARPSAASREEVAHGVSMLARARRRVWHSSWRLRRSATRRSGSSRSSCAWTRSTRRGTRLRPPSSCATYLGGRRPRLRALRARARAREPRRAPARAGRGTEPAPPLSHGHRRRRPGGVVGRSLVGRAARRVRLGPGCARHEGPCRRRGGGDRLARPRGLRARRRPPFRRDGRRGGRRRRRAFLAGAGTPGRRSRRLLRQRGRRRPRARGRPPRLPVLDCGEDERALPAARPRPERPRLDARDRRQRTRARGPAHRARC